MKPLNEEKRNQALSRFGREAKLKMSNRKPTSKEVEDLESKQKDQKGSSDQDFNDLSIAGK